MDRRAYRPQCRHIVRLVIVRDEAGNLDMVMQGERADELEWPDTDARRHIRDNEEYSHGIAPTDELFLCDRQSYFGNLT